MLPVIFKPLAQLELAEAYERYSQPHISMEAALLEDVERTSRYIAFNPRLYQRAEDEVRRANLHRFPYALFYVIDDDVINVLSFFHQHRDPKTREQLQT